MHSLVASALPAFCGNHDNAIWEGLCHHWHRAEIQGLVKNSGEICCDALPEACRSHCMNGGACIRPTCEQEDAYLEEMEPNIKSMFNTVNDFKDCVFTSAKTPCVNDLLSMPDKSANAKLVQDEEKEMQEEVSLLEAEES
mmetsp:Transcript_60786/g.107925  ORF Transcript_60786/g.107925 Transcript_60786/m.107925 type:complete len:140 (+) Transcript_60786:270-689(+)